MRELTVSLLKDEELDEGAIHMMEFMIDVSSKVINMMTSRYGKLSAFLTPCKSDDNNDNPPVMLNIDAFCVVA